MLAPINVNFILESENCPRLIVSIGQSDEKVLDILKGINLKFDNIQYPDNDNLGIFHLISPDFSIARFKSGTFLEWAISEINRKYQTNYKFHETTLQS